MIIATHNGKFHADDVFGVSLLKQLYPDATVVRSRDESVLDSADIVLDVGGRYNPAEGRFDHHQRDAGERSNGILYSAFGLLWQEYGLQFCEGDASVFRRIDSRLVEGIDAVDNGQEIYTLNDYGTKPLICRRCWTCSIRSRPPTKSSTPSSSWPWFSQLRS